MRHRLREWLINGAVLAITLGFLLLVSEIGLRVYEARLMKGPRGSEGDGLRRDVVLDNTLFHQPDQPVPSAWDSRGESVLHIRSSNPRLVYELRPHASLLNGLISINGSGFRDREFEIPKPVGVHRILVVGDSITFGWFEQVDQTYPKVLERLLNQDGAKARRIDVCSLAVGGYNAAQELELIKTKALPLQPDLIILGACVNDGEIGNDAGLWRHFTRSRLRTYDFLRLRWMRVYWMLRHEDIVETAYEELAAWSREHHLPALVVAFPGRNAEGGVDPRGAELIDKARRHALPTLDLSDAYRRCGLEKALHEDGLHPTQIGYSVAATEIARYLRENLSAQLGL